MERKGGRRKEEEEKGKGTEWGGCWERRGQRVKRNEGAWLATRKKIIFLGPDIS